MTDFSRRDPLTGVADLIWQRWSPRAFVKRPLGEGVLERIMDAARWSSSCFNEQPWLFYTSTEDTFPAFLRCLAEPNQAWASNASVLGFVVARKEFSGRQMVNPFAQFDCGSAWMALTLQARTEGLHTHGMGGIDRDAAIDYLNLDTAAVELIMGFAIGEAMDPQHLDDAMRDKEVPNMRVPLESIWISK